MSQRALILIDLQNDYFPGGKWTLTGIAAAAANAARLLAAARASGDLVVHVRHETLRPDATFFVPGTPGAAIHPSLAPRDGETVVVKHFINAFRDTGLKSILDDAGATDLTICGAMSHWCIDAATRAAADHGYAVTVIHDACATRDLDFAGTAVPAAQVHAAFMAALSQGYAKALSTDAYLTTKAAAA
jgi:nicotinamidase-related amidase